MKHLFIILFSIFIFSACANTKNMEEQAIDETNVGENLEMLAESEYDELYQYFGPLFDVTKGEVVGGVQIDPLTAGVAMAGFNEGEYILRAEFINLPQPDKNHFYEGWVVRKEPFNFISTGELTLVDDEYINTFRSQTDYTEYDFYVLTIEPIDDGEDGQPDPAPADHVLEGTMLPIN